MGIRDLEMAVDRLENVLCAEDIPAHVRQEIDRFVTHVAAELMEAKELPACERAELFERLTKAEAN